MPNFRGEENLLRKALDILVENAIKFTHPDAKVHIRLKSDDRFVLIEINDTRVGFPQGEQGRIFDQFYQIEGSAIRRFEGTGLGFALVKEIVKLHDGEIAVRSKVGEGNTFQIKFPAAK